MLQWFFVGQTRYGLTVLNYMVVCEIIADRAERIYVVDLSGGYKRLQVYHESVYGSSGGTYD